MAMENPAGKPKGAAVCSPPYHMHRGHAMIAMLFGLFVVIWGAVWLGNDMGWWAVEFPFLQIAVILVGLGILKKAKMKLKMMA